MMGVTHVFIGTMTAVLLTAPDSAEGCLAALIGGSLGGIICDVDLGITKRTLSLKRAIKITLALILGCFLTDWVLELGLLRAILAQSHRQSLILGLSCLGLLCIWGVNQAHRDGTHSLFAAALYGGCVNMIWEGFTQPFVIAMLLHIGLDLFNCKPVRVLYPLRPGFCFGLCHANGKLDRWLRNIGILGTMFGIGMCVERIL